MKNSTISPRLQRINEAILHSLCQLLLTKVEDKSLRLIQLTKVTVSKDLSLAKVYFLVTDPEQDPTLMLKKLRKVASWFRFELAQTMELRVTPELKFFYDDQHEKVEHLLTLLSKI